MGAKITIFVQMTKKARGNLHFLRKVPIFAASFFGQLKAKKDYNDEGNSEKGRKSEKCFKTELLASDE